MNQASQKSESLFELTAVLGQQTDFQEILRVVSLQAATLFDAEVASLVMINPRTQNTVKTIIKEGKETDRRRYQLAQSNVIGWVSKQKQSFLSADLKTDSRFSAGLFEDAPVRSILCAPLQSEGNSIGYLLVINKSGDGAFDATDLQLLEKMAAITAPFLSNVQKLQEYFHTALPEAALLTKYEPLGLLGKGKSFLELLQAIEAAARCDVRVLLEGQSGTGKERIARAIHQLSGRKDHPFVAIDCGAIPENLIESELFGHAKGAFTGATYERKGLFEEAHRGTLFMDEIANLPYDMQAKLLRVLQEGEIRVVGSNKPRKVEVRIISASSSSLRQLVEQHKFREDLFYRLHVYPIHVPTLNERREDIPLLANHFLKKFAREQQKPAESFHGALLNFMQQRQWSGNVRELENFVERLVTLASPDMAVLNSKILPAEFQKEFKKLAPTPAEHSLSRVASIAFHPSFSYYSEHDKV
jgi:Nif-specific regulatory protein